ncbi:hypothetical protein ACL07V_00300 [Streptomyces sp. MB22_4]|uniref:hypothetical protein n=1 Tax=unclassified Streptomyces TaxID=2593676 RepID=UPI0024A342F5|nr:hypothetical protein [Streptomyces hygroscopicus]GLX53983.1 hypothetical protein Shyhy01_69320 [Streptomyces hygroscopicus subsp. hygroscopicus]
MIQVPPLPDVRLGPSWRVRTGSRGRRFRDLCADAGSGTVEARVERCAWGRLRDAYPVGLRDLEVRVGTCAEGALTDLLTELREALADADPLSRRLVFAVPADDPGRITAAESAGFRPVVDIDLDEVEHTLLTWEPAWATRTDTELDRVPGA